MPLEIVQVDAFTDRPFAGNPAAVCLLEAPADAVWMQRVAREMNLSETAFLVPGDAPASYDLRWFTPAVEVDLCGHATLASAHVLYQDGHVPADRPVRFMTLSGELGARRTAGGAVELAFPAEPVAERPAPEGLLAALGIASEGARFVGKNRMDWLIEVSDEAAVRALAPDMGRLRSVPARGIIVTARAESASDDPEEDDPGGYDFVSRFFGPAAGVDEDPVTGSAHCCLGPYWAAKLDRAEVTGYQASDRGGLVHVRPRGDRVEMTGHAVMVLRGQLLVGP